MLKTFGFTQTTRLAATRLLKFLPTLLLTIAPSLLATIGSQELLADDHVNAYPDFQLETITRLTPELIELTWDFDSRDLVVFDLDNTVFREVQMLGTDEWFSERVHELQLTGLSGREAVLAIDSFNRALKSKTQMKLMEEDLPQLIHNMQARGVHVIGLTARHPKLARSTLRNLRLFGIDFGKTSLPPAALRNMRIVGLDRALGFEGGVAFTDGATKGIVLSHMLKKVNFRPRRLAAVDDRAHHMQSYVELLQDMQIQGVLVHYLKALEESSFEASIAKIQQVVFHKLGIILSDDEANSLRQQSENWITAQNWTCSRLLENRIP
jgi:hypothetical protein